MEDFIGVIKLFAGNYAPRNWMFCDGKLLPVSQYSAFYSLIGNAYGGVVNQSFNLPDLRGRVPIGAGQQIPGLTNRTLGEISGQEKVTLNSSEMPAHTHAATFKPGGSSFTMSVNAVSDDGDSNDPTDRYWASGKNVGPQSNLTYKGTGTKVRMKDDAVEISGGYELGSVTNSTTGGSQGHDNMQPFGVVNYIICWNGIYPPRS